MSRIDDLIAELCPAGVAFLELSAIAETVSGLSGKTKADFTDGSARFVTYKNVFANLAVEQTADNFVKVAPGERQNTLQIGDVVFTGSSETAEEVGMSSIVLTEPTEHLYLNSFCFALRFHDHDLLVPGFSKYLFRGAAVRASIQKSASGVTRINISKQRFMKIRIPVPPVEVQREIVNVLDPFTALGAELAAELEARRCQYLHYRDSLLTLTKREKVGWATLSELFEMRAGKFIAAPAIVESPDLEHPYPCFGGGGLRGYVGQPSHRGDRVLIGRQGALCGNVKRASGEFYATEHAVVVNAKSEVDIRWAFHMLTAMNLNQYASKSAQPGLAVGTIEKLSVPVPSFAEQQRIGVILDRFDSFANDLSIGLPAELNARRQQFEYYRDKLLTFEEAAA